MQAPQAIRQALDMSLMICMSYLQDLDDQDLLQRPHPDCNHINWQIGHLVLSEAEALCKLDSQQFFDFLPEHSAMYGRHSQKIDHAESFCTKHELNSRAKIVREALLQLLEQHTDLNAESGVDYAPTVGALLNVQAAHWLMHAGQWVVVRRQLGKPIIL
ncbi:DinB family protein [Aureliella helgolandensis]|uniref:DinB superfamily protein n=1 Tax=Aureliella helgolandensis TaxID=2527968 RepID=A0A518GAN4_9BACT|nr:DinB family protein [Aureliella helgolandensis]QDV25661.1 DinB superfamily protein [Aureliella helgolandensis]